MLPSFFLCNQKSNLFLLEKIPCEFVWILMKSNWTFLLLPFLQYDVHNIKRFYVIALVLFQLRFLTDVAIKCIFLRVFLQLFVIHFFWISIGFYGVPFFVRVKLFLMKNNLSLIDFIQLCHRIKCQHIRYPWFGMEVL